jgi:Domain of unknown function (DUF6968)
VVNTDRPLTDIVARRELDVRDSDQKVIVDLARPYARPTGEFGCPYRIACGQTVIQREIFGVDAFQALQLALRMISEHLYYDQELPIGRMYWLEPEGDIGFPTPPEIRR